MWCASLVSSRADSAAEASIASSIPWPKIKYLIVAQNREVGDVLSELAQQHGVRSVISPNVKGRVSGRFENIPPGDLLSQLSRSFNLMWMFHNGILYVGTPVEVQTTLVTLRFAKADTVLHSLNSLGILAPGSTMNAVNGSPILSITGLPAFVDITKHIAQTMDNQQQFYQQGEMVIEVFPLNHAWAYDIVLSGDTTNTSGSTGGPGTVIKGVATLLNELVTQSGQLGSGLVTETFAAGGKARPMVGALGPQQAAETARLGFYPGPTGQSSAPAQQPSTPANSSQVQQAGGPFDTAGGPGIPGAYSTNQASIMADVRRNAVVVRDIRENMASYKAAIQRLDVPVRVIEISAAIVDLAIGTSRSLGLNSIGAGVAGKGGIGASATGRPDIVVNDDNLIAQNLADDAELTSPIIGRSADMASVADAPNILASGVFGTVQVMGSINALEQDNKARTLSRPTVLTLDNFGATISRQETFYVNSTGQYVSNLFNVSTGLSLQVIPHVTIDNNRERIYLQVKIEDGQLGARQVTSIPTVQQSSLTTQALIKRNQSLLVGGLYLKVDKKQASGYPWLQRIPVLGYLFSVKGKVDDMVERIFVITPRIVEIDSKGLGDYSKYFQPATLESEAIDEEIALDLPVAEVPTAPTKTKPAPKPANKK
ncbi:MAG: secretin N-terminal domain-containing protein [Spartobacteria bacterium]